MPADGRTKTKQSPGSRSRPSEGEAVSKDEPVLGFATPEEWNEWLSVHHARSSGVAVEIGKGESTSAKRKRLSYAEAVEVALAWGWIDSQKRKLDDAAWLQRFTPRRAKSPWSKINRTKAEALLAAGRMQPSGLAEIERAKADGRWAAAYDSSRTSTVPDDLAAALSANARAAAFFATLDAANRYAVLHRVQAAGKPETRARRIATFVDMLAKHETVHPKRRTRG